MFITPMVPVRSAAELSAPKQTQQPQQAAGGMFADIFHQAINNVKETESALARTQYQLATGQLDDIHSYTIAASKAAAAGELVIQLRSRALDAYNEIMRINL